MRNLVLNARTLRLEPKCMLDFRQAMDSMTARLGEEFLDLVPREKSGNEIDHQP